VRPVAAGRYEVTGPLSIKGVTREIKVPFTVKQEGGVRVFEGEFPIRRLDFKVGEGAWADTGTVADEVRVRLRLVTAAP
jgi:polyisoprenoid-binding protein YceI